MYVILNKQEIPGKLMYKLNKTEYMYPRVDCMKIGSRI